MGKMRSVAVILSLGVAFGAACLCPSTSLAATDNAPASVAELIGQGYQVASVFPIEGGYGVFLDRAGTSVLCQISFDKGRNGFVTDKCIPVY